MASDTKERIIQHRANNFVVMPKNIINDQNLSWRAKGIMSYLLAQADSWQFYQAEICKHSKDGLDSLAIGIQELEIYGYIFLDRIRDNTGKYIGREWNVYENPSDNPNFDPGKIDEKLEKIKKKKEQKKLKRNARNAQKIGISAETGISNPGKTSTGKSHANNNNSNNNNNNKEEEEERSGRDFHFQHADQEINDPIQALFKNDERHIKNDFKNFLDCTGISVIGQASRDTYVKWRFEWGFSHEIIMLAGQLMCKFANSPNLAYIDRILLNWMNLNIRSVPEANKAIESFRAERNDNKNLSPITKKACRKNICETTGSEYELYIPP